MRKELILTPRHPRANNKEMQVRSYKFPTGRKLVPALSVNALLNKRKNQRPPISLGSRKSMDIDTGIQRLTERWKKLTNE